jgi:hypothetical protein
MRKLLLSTYAQFILWGIAGHGPAPHVLTLPSCARPWPVFGREYKTSRNGIVFDVPDDRAALPIASHPMIVRFILPKGISRPPQSRISGACARALDVHQSLSQRYQRPPQGVNVVGHYDPRSEFVQPPLGGAREQDSADTFGHTRILQPQRASGSTIQVFVCGQE